MSKSEGEETLEEELEGRDRKRKITIGVIVAIVVIVSILVAVLITKNSTPATASDLTLAGVNTELQEVKTKVNDMEATTAGHTEDIANLETDLEDIVAPDFSAQFDAINASITAIEESLDGLQYVYVSRAEPGYVDITLFGDGDYAVLTTLYGLNLNSIEVRYPAEYSIAQTWGSNTTVTLAIEPVSAWVSGGLVELKLSGTLYYATATVAQGCEGSAPEW